MGMKYPSELKLEYSVNEKYNKTVDLYNGNISRTGSTVLFFLHRFYIQVGKTLQRTVIMKNVEMRNRKSNISKKRK